MTDLYDEKYFIATKPFQKNEARMAQLVAKVKEYNPTTVLDVGCGFGILVKRLRAEKIDAFGVDFAPVLRDKFWDDNSYLTIGDANHIPFPDKTFDLVISTDFFEHIPEDQIDIVCSEMKRVSRGIILARIAYQAKLHYRQTLYHVTNKPKEWWEAKLPGVILI